MHGNVFCALVKSSATDFGGATISRGHHGYSEHLRAYTVPAMANGRIFKFSCEKSTASTNKHYTERQRYTLIKRQDPSIDTTPNTKQEENSRRPRLESDTDVINRVRYCMDVTLGEKKNSHCFGWRKNEEDIACVFFALCSAFWFFALAWPFVIVIIISIITCGWQYQLYEILVKWFEH